LESVSGREVAFSGAVSGAGCFVGDGVPVLAGGPRLPACRGATVLTIAMRARYLLLAACCLPALLSGCRLLLPRLFTQFGFGCQHTLQRLTGA